jgi:23S rRNA pseudouridine1911/1915/1917 synthase
MKKTRNFRLQSGLIILFEDKDIVITDKPPGLLTMGTEREKEKTAYAILSDYVKFKNRGARIFIVHRLDRETSGILIFAKNEKSKHILQDTWDEARKKYIAVVHGQLIKKEDVLTSYLGESGTHRVFITENQAEGKLAQTSYKVIKETKKFSLLDIELLTGRKHQIRVQLAGIGNPVVGDQKYGVDDGFKKRMALHAYSVSFIHPVTRKPLEITTIFPAYFTQLAGEWKTE